MTNPRRRVCSFLENVDLEPQFGPGFIQIAKIRISDDYSLLGSSEWINLVVRFFFNVYDFPTMKSKFTLEWGDSMSYDTDLFLLLSMV